MKYRPDIDGLRALAISLVLFFHAGISLFPSGFIGVDIFFVISGFLITTLIHTSLKKNEFFLIEFYSRRLWRLQPVFISLIVVTSLFALYFYLPEDFIQFSKSARKTALFLSNQYFSTITSGYFAPDSNQLSLLHTWSLAIEWQCYLLLPLIIYSTHCLINESYQKKLIYGLTFLFLGLSLYYSYRYPTKTYYQFFSRFFEFLIGSSIALNSTRLNIPRYALEIITILAFSFIGYVATLTSINLGFPNYYALGLCLACAILIEAGNYQPQPLITRLFTIKPIVAIGLLSYSLYIWHWPFLAFLRYQAVEETPFVLLIAFTLIFLIAYLSWRFIEKPLRRFHQIKFIYTLLILLIIPMAATSLIHHFIKHHEGYPSRFNDEVVKIYQKLERYNNAERPLCLQRLNTPINPHCLLGSTKSDRKKGLMIGDSFSNHVWGFIDVLAKRGNVSILAHATASCLALPTTALYDWYDKNAIYPECYAQTARYYTMIKQNHYDYVIIGESWEGYLGDKIINQIGDKRSDELSKLRIAEGIENALNIIIDSGAKPILIKATAYSKQDLHACFFKHIKYRKLYQRQECMFALEPQKTQWFDELFVALQKKYKQLVVIDPRQIQCSNGQCNADINGVPMFRDAAGHITDYASYQLGKHYLKQNDNPFAYVG